MLIFESSPTTYLSHYGIKMEGGLMRDIYTHKITTPEHWYMSKLWVCFFSLLVKAQPVPYTTLCDAIGMYHKDMLRKFRVSLLCCCRRNMTSYLTRPFVSHSGYLRSLLVHESRIGLRPSRWCGHDRHAKL